MNKLLTPIEQLDTALRFISPLNKRYLTHDLLKKECFSNSNEIDVTAIIQQLVDDKYIRFDDPNQFKISLNGQVFIARDGYQGDIDKANEEKNRIYQLEIRQSQMASRLYWINLTIAIGTSIAAIYYIVELYWKYHWFH